MSGVVLDDTQMAAATSYLNKLLKAEKYRKGGELDPATQQLRDYMKTEGVIDISRFRNEYKSKQMHAKISKDSLLNKKSLTPKRQQPSVMSKSSPV